VKTVEIIKFCRRNHIELSVDGELLSIRGDKSQVTPTLLNAIKDKKREILKFLSADIVASSPAVKPETTLLTPSDFPNAIVDQTTLDELCKNYPGFEKLYLATSMQRGMLFHGIVDSKAESYTNQVFFNLDGALDTELFKRTWQYVVNHHDILRSALVGLDSEHIHQLVCAKVTVPFSILDWRCDDEQTQQRRFEQLLAEDVKTGFDFSKAPLMRVILIHMSDQSYRVLWSHHHAILDGWCTPIIFAQMLETYASFRRGEDPDLPPSPPFEGYIRWLHRQDMDVSKAYWQNLLADINEPNKIRLFTGHSDSIECATGPIKYKFSRELTERLQATAKYYCCTLNVLLQAAWSIILSRMSGRDDVVFGTTVSGRPEGLESVEQMLGLFINTLPMVVRIKPNLTVRQLLDTMQQDNMEKSDHAFLPLNEIQKLSLIPTGLGLFDSILVFNNYPVESVTEKAESRFDEFTINNVDIIDSVNFTIGIEAWVQGSLHVAVNHDSRQLSHQDVWVLVTALQTLLEQLVSCAPDSEVNNLSLLQDNVHKEGTGFRAEQSESTLLEKFEQNLISTPQKVIVRCDDKSMNLAQLNTEANKLATHLLETGLQPGQRVGLCLERSIDIPKAILACFKAGLTYVPLASDYPEQRLAFIASDCELSCIIAHRRWSERNAFSDINILVLDDEEILNTLNRYSDSAPPVNVSADDIAYVIYTSGSTGQPKGVAVSHANLNQFAVIMSEQFDTLGLEDEDSWLWHASFAFDASIKGLVALCYGRPVILSTTEESRSPQALLSLLKENQLKVFNGIPQLMEAMLDLLEKEDAMELNLLVSGDDVPEKLWQRIADYCQANDTRAINAYGPTELSVNAAFSVIDGGSPVNIGQIVRGSYGYVLDHNGQLLPDGFIGELYVGGACVSQGYVNQAEKATECFVDDPFFKDGGKLYRTGDLVRRLSDGRLQFVGRQDHQVKVRGYRIELREIESCLQALNGVREAKVALSEGLQQLVACVIPTGTGGDLNLIKEQLAKQLPEYMLPLHWFELEAWPLTEAGKIDIQALSQLPVTPRAKGERTSKAEPNNDIELQLCQLWSEILKIEHVGLDDNFFALGGDSILSIQMVSRAMKLGLKFKGRDFYKEPTVRALAKVLTDDAAAENPAVEVEKQLQTIWADVLKLDNVDIQDNFFSLGGDSILSIQMVSKAAQAGIKFAGRDFFANPTIAALAEKIVKKNAAATQPEIDSERSSMGESALTLLPVQQQYLNLSHQDKHHFNQSVLLELPVDLEPAELKLLMRALYRRHDTLRLKFVKRDGNWHGQYSLFDDAMVARALQFVDLSKVSDEQLREEVEKRADMLQQSLNLEGGDLVRIVHMDCGPERAGRLLMIMHHLIVDGVSWRIILADLSEGFERLRQGETVTLDDPTASLQQWSNALSQYSKSDRLEEQKNYWQQLLARPCKPLPVDMLIDERHIVDVGQLSITLDEEQTRRLLTEAQIPYQTRINELLLSALYLALGEWTGDAVFCINMESHGRNLPADEPDISETLGWFTAKYPLVLCSDGQEVTDVVCAIKDDYRKIPDNGIGFSILTELCGERSLKEANKADLQFNYLGQFDQTFGEGSPFSIANEYKGKEAADDYCQPYKLVINALVSNGRLQVGISYHHGEYKATTVQALANTLKTALKNVIEHCCSAEPRLTPSDFPLAEITQAQLDQWQRHYRLADIYPATSMQSGMLFHGILEQDSGAYVSQTWLTLSNRLDTELFRQAWERVISRHAVLRTAFVGFESQIQQLVMREVTLPWNFEDWRELSTTKQMEEFEAYREADKLRGFDFGEAPLMRFALWQLSDERYQILWTHHHALVDGWCISLLFAEVMANYQGLRKGESVVLPEAAPYRDYIEWLVKCSKEEAEQYWVKELEPITNASRIDFGQSSNETGYTQVGLSLDAEQTEALGIICRRLKVTPNTMVQAAWGYLLHRYLGHRHVTFGATVSGRPAELDGVERMVGLFINTVPVRVSISADTPLETWLTDLHLRQQESNQFAYLSLSDIQKQSPLRSELFNTLVIYENYAVTAGVSADSGQDVELGLDSQVSTSEGSNYDLTLVVQPGEQINFELIRKGTNADTAFITTMLTQFKNVLSGMITQGNS